MQEVKLIILMITAVMVVSGNLSALPKKEAILTEKIKALSSHNKDARREAMDEVYREVKRNQAELSMSKVEREQIKRYMLRWERNSEKAVLVFGLLKDRESVSAIRQVLEDARRIQSKKDPMDDRNVLAPRMELACLKALLALNDADAVKKVKQLLKEDAVASKVRAMDCIQFAEKSEFIPEILPLLNDTRDAVNIAPSGGEYYIRVCDIAINVIEVIAEVNVSFSMQHGARYNEQMRNEFRTNVRAWLAENKRERVLGAESESVP